MAVTPEQQAEIDRQVALANAAHDAYIRAQQTGTPIPISQDTTIDQTTVIRPTQSTNIANTSQSQLWAESVAQAQFYGGNAYDIFQAKLDSVGVSQRFLDIQSQYAIQHNAIVGSSGVLNPVNDGSGRYTYGAGYAEEAQGTFFQANVLTQYQQQALGQAILAPDATQPQIQQVLDVRGLTHVAPSVITQQITPWMESPQAAQNLGTFLASPELRKPIENWYWGTGGGAGPRTAMDALYMGRGDSPMFVLPRGSASERFGFDEYGKVLTGGKFEPATSRQGVPDNPKMGNGEYVYVGEYHYMETGENVSRYYNPAVGSYIDVTSMGVVSTPQVGVRGGGSPGAFRETAGYAVAMQNMPVTVKAGTQVAGYNGVVSVQKGGLPDPFLSTPGSVTTRIEQPSGALPFIGVVPFLSPALAFFEPSKIVTETTTLSNTPTTVTTGTPQIKTYTVGNVTYTETTTETITSGGQVKTITSTTKEGTTAFNQFVSERLPQFSGEGHGLGADIKSPLFAPWTNQEGKQFYVLDVVKDTVRNIPVIGGFVSGTTGKDIDEMTKGPVSFAQGVVPMTPVWVKDTYANLREDPGRTALSIGITTVFVGAGTILKVGGVGTKFLPTGSTGASIYSGLSMVASGAMVTLYGSSVSERVTGISLEDIQHNLLPKMNAQGQIVPGEGIRGLISDAQKNFPGWEQARKNLNVVQTQELIPMAATYGTLAPLGDKLAGWARTRGQTQIPPQEVRQFSYGSEEGFPTNQNIKTGDLIDSFNTGTITLKNPYQLAETKMAPDMGPLQRIPTGTQIGVPEGKAYIYSGAERPHLVPGKGVGESFSEVTQAMYMSPEGLTYFAKPGTGGQGGFGAGMGITSDIFGLYKIPTMYRGEVKAGKYQEIPSDVLHVQTNGQSLNDPTNPRNIAIDRWITGSYPEGTVNPRQPARFGEPIIGQYGKSEWQYLIRTGTEVKSVKPVGWYYDAGQRVQLVDVVFGTKAAKGYSPRTEFEIGRFSAETPLSSIVSSGNEPSIAPALAISTMVTSKPETTISVTRTPEIHTTRIAMSESSPMYRSSIPGYTSEPPSTIISPSGSSPRSSPASSISSIISSRIYPRSSSSPISSSRPFSSSIPEYSSESGSSSKPISSSIPAYSTIPSSRITTKPSTVITTTPSEYTTETPSTDLTTTSDITRSELTEITTVPGGMGGIPPGASGSSGGYMREVSWTYKNPVGADLLGKARGKKFTKMPVMKMSGMKVFKGF